ncbi:TPA: hypothetical protein ACIJO6_003928 [Klebsiella aerogenes]|uniref:hypothetical protein n=1 Tax=Klebsiella aerogenes TaxID=548 RepID=UPI000A8B35AD|nr:hypothetical protein [Klebsiella aerogenes]
MKMTKESLLKVIGAADDVLSALAGTNDEVHKDDTDKMVRLWDDLNDRYAPPEVVRELARMALAPMDSEPVAWRYRTTDINGNPNQGWSFSEETSLLGLYQPLYAAPQPAPVVQDERYHQLSELYHAQEKRLFKIAQRIKGPTFDKYSHSPSQAIDVLETVIFGEDDACRAAMLAAAPQEAK